MNGKDNIKANGGNDQLFGAAGNDTLTGGAGRDTLIGGAGADILSGGKSGDVYRISLVGDSKASALGAFDAKTGDSVKDFTSVKESSNIKLQDKIDLGALTKTQALTWTNLTASKFGVWYGADVATKKTYVYADTTGDGIADISLKINTLETLSGKDFKGVTLDITAPTAPIVALVADTGTAGDNITSNGTLNVTGLEEGATLEYSIDAGKTWTAIFNAILGLNTVLVRQTDVAGNISAPSIPLTFTLDLNVDLATLSANQGLIIRGAAAGDKAGQQVSSAGDVNGDGFDDMIVGAPYADTTAANDEGAAYVIFGGVTTSLGNIDLSNLGTKGFKIQGAAAFGCLGLNVSSAGDINGDGFDDLIIGAHKADKVTGNGVDVGAAYVIFGSAANPGSIELSDLGNKGFKIEGAAADDRAGRGVSSAGDINGDGFDDLMVGAYKADGTKGAAYVIFGKGTGFIDINLSTVGTTTTPGFKIQGAATGDIAGFRVSLAGDVNGDGFHDVIVGALGGDQAAVVFGGANSVPVDLGNLGASGFKILGAAGDRAGFSVSSAGDINGDGFDDIIVGAFLADKVFALNDDEGAAYVIFGHAGPFTDINLSTALTTGQGFKIQGAAAEDRAGVSVSSAGDVNGDGFDDLIVGAYLADKDLTDTKEGAAYVVFGKSSGFADINLGTLIAAQGFKIEGAAAGDGAGFSVSSAGDVNGDGFDDLMVGAYGADNAGAAYIIYGGAFGKSSTPVTTTGTTAAEMLIGGLGNDTLVGNGGADVLRGGAGNDILGVTGTTFKHIDGGNGHDILRMDGAGDVFHFIIASPTNITSIEAFDMRAAGNQSLFIDKLDVFELSDDVSGGITTLTIYGNNGDNVGFDKTAWTKGSTPINFDNNDFDIYTNGNARLLVDTDIQVL